MPSNSNNHSHNYGYFEPHTASYDFCEANYVYTPYCAELWNAVSSLFIIYVGYVALTKTVTVKSGPYYDEMASRERTKQPHYRNRTISIPFQCTLYPRFLLCWLFFGLVGGGSFLFHACLQRWAQACDELPMVIANVLLLFQVLCCRKLCMTRRQWEDHITQFQLSNPNTLSSILSKSLDTEDRLWESHYKFRACVLMLMGLFHTCLYLAFENYAFFLITYSLGLYLLIYIAYYKIYVQLPFFSYYNKQLYRQLFMTGLGCYGVGSILWILEHVFCDYLAVLHLHIFWHVLASWGTMIYMLASMVNYLDSLGIVMEDFRYDRFGVPKITFTF